jgi:hypothetical protein
MPMAMKPVMQNAAKISHINVRVTSVVTITWLASYYKLKTHAKTSGFHCSAISELNVSPRAPAL